LVLLLMPTSVFGAGWTVGAGLGFGGQGITKQVEAENGALQTVQRSESPLVAHLFADRVVLPSWAMGFEHSRGFRLGPFSSGVGFTSLNLRWYYLAPPIEPITTPEKSTFFEKRWTPYTGFTLGLANGKIQRQGDIFDEIGETGVHIGLKNGIDYFYDSQVGLRIELSVASTLMQGGARPGALQEFSLWSGFFFPLSWD
jgi:hypothetical protein